MRAESNFENRDHDNSGFIESNEVPPEWWEGMFSDDTNGDGKLSLEEYVKDRSDTGPSR